MEGGSSSGDIVAKIVAMFFEFIESKWLSVEFLYI